MRHKKRGRTLGRSSSHRRAMLRNLASSLFLSERPDDLNLSMEEYHDFETPATGRNIPKVKGRVVTTLQKAKEARSLVEKCITIARRAQASLENAEQYAGPSDRRSEEWQSWRKSDQWQQWNQAIAPALAARRRALKLLGNKFAVEILFDDIAPRFLDRDGGYTRVVRLATPRLGDAGTRAILEFVGVRDRVPQSSDMPAFDDEEESQAEDTAADAEEAVATEETAAEAEETASAEETEAAEESAAEEESDD